MKIYLYMDEHDMLNAHYKWGASLEESGVKAFSSEEKALRHFFEETNEFHLEGCHDEMAAFADKHLFKSDEEEDLVPVEDLSLEVLKEYYRLANGDCIYPMMVE